LPAEYILGIDLGTSSLKASLLDLYNTKIISASVELTVSYPDSYSAEQNPYDWWEAFRTLIQKIKQLIGSLDSIKAIGLSGQMLGLINLDGKGQPLRPALIWCDQRSFIELNEIREMIGEEKLLQNTANTPLTGYWLPKLLWLRKHQKDILQKSRHYLLPKDYLRYRLTDEYITEVSDASGTLLFDVAQRTWSRKLIKDFNFDFSCFPRVVESTEITGYVSLKVSQETGLPEGIPVVGGGGDQSSGGIGLGVIDKNIMSCVLGTSGVVMAQTEEAKMDQKNRGLHSFCYSIPGKWFLMGCTLAAGGSYRWLRHSLLHLQKDLSYDHLNSLAGEVGPGSDQLVFLPYLIGERTPHSDPNARGVYFGLSYQHDIRHIIRATIEGVAFSQKESIEILKDFGLEADHLIVSGGAARSQLWCQIMADVAGIEVVTTNIDDPASVGAAFIAGVGTGIFDSFQSGCGRFIRHGDVLEPSSENNRLYKTLFEKYQKLYQVLKNYYQDYQVT
jgi:xylulokinase